jgi:HK97 family phage prohead protease
MTNNVELRYIKASELRAVTTDGALHLTGYAAVFNSASGEGNLDGFRERVKPGAFTQSLKDGDDVRCLWNHDQNFVLGRSRNSKGTLELKEDSTGLWFDCTLPETEVAKGIHTSVARGDVDQCSFAFVCVRDKWSEEDNGDGTSTIYRDLHEVRLRDVSAVTYPVYEDTSVKARNAVEVPVEIRSLIERRKKEQAVATKIEKRADDASLEQKMGQLYSALSKAVGDKFGYEQSPWPLYNICETYDTYVICAKWDSENGQEFIKVPYEFDGENVKLGKPEGVTPETQWVTERARTRSAELRTARKELRAAAKETRGPEGDGKTLTKVVSENEPVATGQNADADAAEDTVKISDEHKVALANAAAKTASAHAELKTAKAAVKSAKLAKQTAMAEESALKETVGVRAVEVSMASNDDEDLEDDEDLDCEYDCEHDVANAIERFKKTADATPEAKEMEWNKIEAAAKKLGVSISEDDKRAIMPQITTDLTNRFEMLDRIAKSGPVDHV